MAKTKDRKKQLLDELLDEVVEDCKTPEDILGENGILKQLTKGVVERMLQAEMTDHLGYEKSDPAGQNSGNSRNGSAPKTILTGQGEVPLDVPRDRNADFDPQIIPKRKRRFPEFDDKVISLYARGMTTREIQGHLKELYGVQVSPELISTITDAVIDEVTAWQNRPLDNVYPIVYLDALFVKIRDSGTIKKKAVYLALGVNMQGEKELLGLWIAQTEGAKFWLNVLTELKNRGLKDIFIACVDGLTGFPDAIETVYPQTDVQLCIVHLVRHSLQYVTWKDRKKVAASLRPIYAAATVEEAEANLEAFATEWDTTYASISKSWRRNWTQITPFLAYPPEIRKVIYTTNAIESMNRSLRKIIKNRGAFPNDQAATKLLYLAIRNISQKWSRPIRDWKAALNRFAIMFEDRVPLP